MHMKRISLFGLFILFLLTTGMLLSGCSSNSVNSTNASKTSDKKVIKIGASPEAIPLVQSGVASLEAMGYKVEVIPFDDFFVPNVALNEGSIDANLYQHKPFLDNYNQKNGTNIQMVMSLYNFYHCIYSKQAASINDIPQGGQFGIANDASNINNDLRLLAKNGLITLKKKDNENDLYGIIDIVDNPKNLKFIQIDYVQRYASFDKFAAMTGCSNTTFVAGLNPMDNVLYKEVDDKYALGLCINGNNSKAEDKWVKDLITAYTSDGAYKYVQDYFKGAYTRAEQFEQLVKK